MKKIVAGLLLAALWGSELGANKLVLKNVLPLLLTSTRFVIAASLVLLFALIINKERLPQKQERQHLFLYGLLNVA